MLDDAGNLAICPEQIAVIGGGRWARVLTGVLCGIAPPTTKIFIYTSHNADSMSSWVSSEKFKQNIVVSASWPELNSEQTAGMIVVNAARDHEKAIECGLNADIPVLVEKPVSFSEKASQRLVDLSKQKNVRFASAHIFLFARYLNNFLHAIPETEKIQHIQISWMDPQAESRYGEQKQYDSGLPIHVDWLPHVISIVGSIIPDLSPICESLDFKRGGAHLNIDLMYDDIPCAIELVRNGGQRRRIVEVETNKDVYAIDFSKEPGIITYGESEINGDSAWESEPRPAAQMLMAFLTWAAAGKFDTRLNIEVGLRANNVIDQVSKLYNKELIQFLVEKFVFTSEFDGDLRYALKEILSSEGPINDRVFEDQIAILKRHFSERRFSCFERLNDITSTKDYIKLVVQKYKK